MARLTALFGWCLGLGVAVATQLAWATSAPPYFLVDAEGRRLSAGADYLEIARGALMARPAPREDTRFRIVWAGEPTHSPGPLAVVSLGPSGEKLDEVPSLTLQEGRCEPRPGHPTTCLVSPLLRLSPDRLGHQILGQGQLVMAGVTGGSLQVRAKGSVVFRIAVGGPKSSTQGVGRLRATLRVRIVREEPGGPPPLGGDDAGAVAILRDELRITNGLWGQCGIQFGDERGIDIQVVDPPQARLLAVGCGFALPASGGTVSFRLGSEVVKLATHRGELPSELVRRLARAAQGHGFRSVVYKNPRTTAEATGSYDLALVDQRGAPVSFEPDPHSPLSTDPSLRLCLGDVDLSDGLQHFTDSDSAVGTVEERALLRALGDDDPATIDVLVIPTFGLVGRIGESFIARDGSGLGSSVIVDRAGIRAGAKSFTLAHELGHVLLDVAGHPDDFGVDQPGSLMDSDASDDSELGPRRLSLDDCERAYLQSGPDSPVRLLTPWPLLEGAGVQGTEPMTAP